MTDESPAPPFNEQEALADLERLRAEIVAARVRREALSAEFDAFVRSFRVRPPAQSPDESPALSPGRTVRDVRHEYDLEPSAEFAAEMPTARTGNRAAAVWPAVVAAAAAFLLVTAVLSARLFREAPEPVADRAAAPPPPARTSPPAPAGNLRVELRTLRPVWARAFVDGRKAFERELPAGERVPLQATRVIVVRVGDAGAIRLAVDGKDQGPLGPDGAPVTRLVTASPR
ncbi:MAG TPA: DUF4115 domain-containing protein [Vicinamibacterales bacterium]|nr:DUF4115 domain-containing protein [Vicinamibacterales bacterium]